VLYVVFRIVPPPGAEAPESLDAIGLITKATELCALVACVVLARRAGARVQGSGHDAAASNEAGQPA
ncbi:MAG: hypothetical protein ACRDGW_01765, partial [Actinomycetota bacterium]